MKYCPDCSSPQPPKKPRSAPQHRRFFGMVGAAYKNWPSSHEMQPATSEVLRSWLIAKANFVDRTVVEPPEDIASPSPRLRKIAILTYGIEMAAATQGHPHHWVRPHGEAVVVFVPKSVAFHEMGHQEFGLLNDAVSLVLEEHIGLSGDKLLERQKEVA